MKSLTGPIIKSLIFVVVTVLATALLALTISNGSSAGTRTVSAVFSDVTSLNVGDDVRMAGVRIGSVQSIGVHDRRLAEISMSVESSVPLAKTVTATIRYRNLIGQRYVALDEGTGSLDDALPPNSVLPLTQTTPALDLTALFNGFQPLFRALDPQQINELSGEIIQVFQGEGPTVDDLIAQTATLTGTLASKDRVITSVIDNLGSVLRTVNAHGGQLSTLIITLQRLVSGLAADRSSIGGALTGIAALTTDVGDLLRQGRAPLQGSIHNLSRLAGNLAASTGTLNSFLQTLPLKLTGVARAASYGSWVNTYLCSLTGRIPVPGDYYAGVGVQPVAGRCR